MYDPLNDPTCIALASSLAKGEITSEEYDKAINTYTKAIERLLSVSQGHVMGDRHR